MKPRGKQPDENEVTYGSYLRLEELLALQTPRSAPEHPDELLFIIVHQASELWFKLILHELGALQDLLGQSDTLGALSAVRRVNALVRIVTGQLSALETLPPQRFAQFRGYLGTSSGSQSSQFRAIEAISGLRDAHFMQTIEAHGELPDLVKAALGRPGLQELFQQAARRAQRRDRRGLFVAAPETASDARGGAARVRAGVRNVAIPARAAG